MAGDLFPDAPTIPVQPMRSSGRQPTQPRLVAETDCWTVEDHVCRACLGRILSRAGANGRVYMCSMCGQVDASGSPGRRPGGRQHPPFCACSINYGPRDAGIRCEVNEAPGPELPQAVIARQVG